METDVVMSERSSRHSYDTKKGMFSILWFAQWLCFSLDKTMKWPVLTCFISHRMPLSDAGVLWDSLPVQLEHKMVWHLRPPCRLPVGVTRVPRCQWLLSPFPAQTSLLGKISFRAVWFFFVVVVNISQHRCFILSVLLTLGKWMENYSALPLCVMWSVYLISSYMSLTFRNLRIRDI